MPCERQRQFSVAQTGGLDEEDVLRERNTPLAVQHKLPCFGCLCSRREKIRPASVVSGWSVTIFALHAENGPKSAIFAVHGEFCTASGMPGCVLGEFCTASGMPGCVLGEFCPGSGMPACAHGEFSTGSGMPACVHGEFCAALGMPACVHDEFSTEGPQQHVYRASFIPDCARKGGHRGSAVRPRLPALSQLGAATSGPVAAPQSQPQSRPRADVVSLGRSA